jgi:hypothetical protein
MTPIKTNAFATELVKVAGKLDVLKSLSGAKDALVKLVAKHPEVAMGLGGAGVGAATADEDHWLRGALAGGALGATFGHLGRRVGGGLGITGDLHPGFKNRQKNWSAARKARHVAEHEKRVAKRMSSSGAVQGAAIGAGAGGLTGGLLSRGSEKKAMMDGLEQPAMGTGKGMKRPKAMKKRAQEGEPDVQDVLSEMLSQSQYQPDPQESFWADQGSTMQEGIDDPVYGHGKGLGKKTDPKSLPMPKPAQAKAPASRTVAPKAKFGAPKPATKPAPKSRAPERNPEERELPVPVRPERRMLAMKTAQQFLSGLGRR